jgi:septum formation inhibitor MinC
LFSIASSSGHKNAITKRDMAAEQLSVSAIERAQEETSALYDKIYAD